MADLVDGMTERLLIDAGIGPGMRVLDVGCGRGDVSFLLARIMKAEGHIVAIDREPAALTVARERARQLGIANVSFVEGDLCALSPEHRDFDAAVGRRVLMYQRDPVDAIRRLARSVRPGGCIIFQEHDSTMVPACRTPLPLHQRVHEWIWRTVEREGANVHMGFDLSSVLEQAGLIVEHVRAEAVVQTSTVHRPVGPIVRAMLPRIVQQGVATEAEMGIDTLDQRLIDERADATYIGDMVFGAWARKPS